MDALVKGLHHGHGNPVPDPLLSGADAPDLFNGDSKEGLNSFKPLVQELLCVNHNERWLLPFGDDIKSDNSFPGSGGRLTNAFSLRRYRTGCPGLVITEFPFKLKIDRLKDPGLILPIHRQTVLMSHLPNFK
ncbi:conserved hypothetical protein [delta proteobacterium NaphS2]|nr:conserved hypothetical protein [delta proteobacterium NaphS2]